MTHDDSSNPEVDPADVPETVDDESTAEASTQAVSLDASDTDGDAEAGDSAAETESDVAESDETDSEPAPEDSADTDSSDEDAEDSDEAVAKAEKKADRKAAKKRAKAERVDDDEPSSRKPFASMALAAAVAALIGAVVCIGYFGYTGVRAYTVDATATELREESLDVAQQAVLNITSVDPSDLKGWEERLKSSLTGDALKQVDPATLSKAVEASQASGGKAGRIESKIARSAVTSLNTDDNTATVLVFTNVSAVNQNQPVQNDQMGFLLTIVEVDGARKANKVVPLNPIEYSEGGSGVSQAPGEQPQEGGN